MKENRKRYQCPNCGWTVSEELEKKHLEHCPNCLHSIHLDNAQLPAQYPSGQ